MKTSIPVVCLMFFCVSLYAQAVTIDNEPAKVEYYRLPDQPLDPSYATYSANIQVSFSELANTGLSKSSLIDQYVRLDGYKKVSEHGDVEITANIGDFTIWSESRSSRRTKTKDKNGVEHVKYNYYMEVRYSLPMSLAVYDKKGFLLMDRSISSSSNTQTWTSPSYSDLSDLESYWRIQRPSRLSQLQKEETEKGLREVNNQINLSFGYRKINETVKFETIGKKKVPQYEDFQHNVETIQTAFKTMSADQDLEGIKKMIKPALDFYATNAAKYKSNSKDDTRLRHICLYNQAMAYFWTENFEKAQSFIEELQRMNKKDKPVKRLAKDLEDTQTSLSTAHRTSRHKIVIGGKS